MSSLNEIDKRYLETLLGMQSGFVPDYEGGLLKRDVKKFSHGLRDFRNYIHPYEQMVSGFSPDEHTAKVCFKVLKAALASVAGERG
ncbi:hypothetical protein [uncultured Rhodoblastus sp.]|uniref:hypothetical protein n=1 Tax=uncultured Rhodoblastus sp. TaxID=543037 RepID=UPI0025D6259A|nr:hypothetical protein [uncultured Rhodoblastus sp.]